MRQQGRRQCLLSVLFAALLLVLTSCGKPVQALANLKSSVDEAGSLLSRAADPSEFKSLSTKIDDMLKGIPEGTSLSASEKATVDAAAQRAAALKQVAAMLGVSDEVMGFISKDAVELVSASLIRTPSQAFRQHLDATARRLLKSTTCSLYADRMSGTSKSSPSPLPGIPSSAPFQPPTHITVWEEFRRAITAANYQLDAVNEVMDLSGLSSELLDTASGYVSKVKKVMTAAEWESSGALQVYLRHCLR
ncbi:hypothetical protein RI444_09520 [Paenarthrobacter sp. AT5]|uniref:hypothetical protein n=1 Tax=Paenarthrobacter TaxID=1742992 RepID=UPI001A97E45E|nr:MULTISPECIES: hypothetical protein [Paenarthrobacter]MEC3853961.1 hypothetical protein [Paenarthrobacter ureafaciens]QSZ54038.1 hypothetical protein AYX19_14275 [Paenarthrobacter ureafaciens]WOC62832.1 hypothetical protein RI444_09520 [Paenarthrobacter sp. AT5]